MLIENFKKVAACASLGAHPALALMSQHQAKYPRFITEENALTMVRATLEAYMVYEEPRWKAFIAHPSCRAAAMGHADPAVGSKAAAWFVRDVAAIRSEMRACDGQTVEAQALAIDHEDYRGVHAIASASTFGDGLRAQVKLFSEGKGRLALHVKDEEAPGEPLTLLKDWLNRNYHHLASNHVESINFDFGWLHPTQQANTTTAAELVGGTRDSEALVVTMLECKRARKELGLSVARRVAGPAVVPIDAKPEGTEAAAAVSTGAAQRDFAAAMKSCVALVQEEVDGMGLRLGNGRADKACFLQTGIDYRQAVQAKQHLSEGQFIMFDDAKAGDEEAKLVVCRVVGGKPMEDGETPQSKKKDGQADLRFNGQGARPQMIFVWNYVELEGVPNVYVLDEHQKVPDQAELTRVTSHSTPLVKESKDEDEGF